MTIKKALIGTVSAVLLTLSFIQANAQDEMVRSFDASCSEICDGSAELLTFRYLPERYFYWMAENNGRYHTMNHAILDSLCPGQYRIRQVDVSQKDMPIKFFNDTTRVDFEGISSMEFSSLGKRELSLFIKLDKEINHLNYYLKAEYSHDDGYSWSSSQQFHQKVIEDAAGNKHVYYLLNFPRSAQEKNSVIVNIYQRRTDRLSGQPDFKVERAFLESKEFEEYAFEIGIKENIRIRSTISNEVEGEDGYVRLILNGGSPPYECVWEDGNIGEKKEGLSAGSYSVTVNDKKNCSQSARFVILPPDGVASKGQFQLNLKGEGRLFELESKRRIYRQPMDLIFNSMDSIEVKRFQINPLYEDLRMELDLSFLDSGEYTATLSTSNYSKNIAIRID